MQSQSGLWIVSLQEDSSDRFTARFSSQRGYANVLGWLGVGRSTLILLGWKGFGMLDCHY